MAEPVLRGGLTEQEGRRPTQIVRRGKGTSIRVRCARMFTASASRTPVLAIADWWPRTSNGDASLADDLIGSGAARCLPSGLGMAPIIYGGEDQMHRAKRALSVKIGSAVAMIVLVVGSIATAGVAQGNQPRMSHDWNPQLTPHSTSGAYWKAPRGATVTMFCWTGGPTKLGTGKWFKIRANSNGQPTGFVPANAVWPQVPTPRC